MKYILSFQHYAPILRTCQLIMWDEPQTHVSIYSLINEQHTIMFHPK